MLTSINNFTEQVTAIDVHFTNNVRYVSFSDGREIGIPIDRIEWLD